MNTLGEALARALGRETRAGRGASLAARDSAHMRRWALGADAETRRCVREARISVEGRRGGGHWRWEAAIPWTGAWRSEMEWQAAAHCGTDPTTMEVGDSALYESASEALAAVAGEASERVKAELVRLAGPRWAAHIERGLAEIDKRGRTARKHRWRTADVITLARLRPAERARVLDEPPWLAEHALGDAKLRRAQSRRWRGRAAARAAGADPARSPSTVARAQAMLERWRAQASAPPLKAVWACAQEGITIEDDSAWAAATEAERRGASAKGCLDAVRRAQAQPTWLEEQLKEEARAKIASACGLGTQGARKRLETMERAWGTTGGMGCTLWWRDDWSPLWWAPYGSVAAILSGAGRGTRASSRERTHREQAMRELYLFTGQVLTLNGTGLVRKRDRRKKLDPRSRDRAAAAFAHLPARA